MRANGENDKATIVLKCMELAVDCFEMHGAGRGQLRMAVGHPQCLGVTDFLCNFNIILRKSSI